MQITNATAIARSKSEPGAAGHKFICHFSIDYTTIPILSTSPKKYPPCMASLMVFRTHEISKRLWFFVFVMMSVIVVTVVMWIIHGPNILHLQDISAFRAALDRALARHLATHVRTGFDLPKHSWRGTYGEPDRNMGIGGVAGAASILLITKRLDNNRVVERACNPPH
jgi:hypothetical protein